MALGGCAAQADSLPISKAATGTCVTPGTWFDPGRGQTLTTPEALARVKKSRVVLLGETHIVPDHHRWHMQTVAQLYAQRPNMILGFEAFPRRVQPVLDAWIAGTLTEAQFIKKSEWETVWRYDVQLYMPLFHFARLNHIPMVALNVDRSLIAKVSKGGWNAVPKNERLGVGDSAPASDGYIKMLGESYGLHSNGNGGHNGAPMAPGLSDPRFAGFVDVQVTWDRAMAEATATALKAAAAQGQNPQLVAVIGRGHLDYGFGVPHQLAALNVNDVQVLAPWDKLRPCDDLAKSPPPADLVFGLATTEDYLPGENHGPKLGVMIESTDGGVRIKDIVKGSIAERANLKMDDLILRAAGQAVAKTGDLVTIITNIAPGTWLPLTIQRGGKSIEIIARFPALKSTDKPTSKP